MVTKQVFEIGEALLGAGAEVAHIDLMIGDKSGPVGIAFANALSQLSMGHTPLLAVIRPNLPPKPFTAIIPKVTVKSGEDISKIFGPAQASVAKAIADAVEEGVVPSDKLDEWVIVVSVFISPQAKDMRKIYHYNYGATKLALKRALTRYPDLKKIIYDKDRARHPIMGFKVPRLWRPPYLQIAIDNPSIKMAKRVIQEMAKSDRIILEAGTPLIKRYGVSIINELRQVDGAKDIFFIADLKTLDVGKVEVDMAYEETADGVVGSALANKESLDKFIYEAKRVGIYAIVDMMNVPDPIGKLKSLKELPDVVILHKAIDTEAGEGSGTDKITNRAEMVAMIKQEFPKERMLIAVAGGIRPETAPEALQSGADIIIVGRYITQSRDIERSTREFVRLLAEKAPKAPGDVDLFRVHEE
ncbi:MAG: bifunctional 5,6,7,8-tetrahydromethanopterin hydro-lyase/3-hexulose-6-phosphate synthase [Candidatus Helarchaeota archaeon]|nr:bifunctional 5,6,7,8-tetrahydromethanopterin hydro-lyase/3-hexulose-6-phosphate synthase [Candidatus Helarchaeota archaeon]